MDSEDLLERVRALRATGRTPNEIARAFGPRPAQVAPPVRTIAAEDHACASERKLTGCRGEPPGGAMGSPLRIIPAGPMSTPPTPKPSAWSACWSPQERYGRVRLCGWLVDVYC